MPRPHFTKLGNMLLQQICCKLKIGLFHVEKGHERERRLHTCWIIVMGNKDGEIISCRPVFAANEKLTGK